MLESTTHIGHAAFAHAYRLERLELPETLREHLRGKFRVEKGLDSTHINSFQGISRLQHSILERFELTESLRKPPSASKSLEQGVVEVHTRTYTHTPAWNNT